VIIVELLSLRVSLLDGGDIFFTVVLNNYILRSRCELFEGDCVIRAVIRFCISRGQRPWRYISWCVMTIWRRILYNARCPTEEYKRVHRYCGQVVCKIRGAEFVLMYVE
jgi:hypothetical protein